MIRYVALASLLLAYPLATASAADSNIAGMEMLQQQRDGAQNHEVEYAIHMQARVTALENQLTEARKACEVKPSSVSHVSK